MNDKKPTPASDFMRILVSNHPGWSQDFRDCYVLKSEVVSFNPKPIEAGKYLTEVGLRNGQIMISVEPPGLLYQRLFNPTAG